MLARFKDGYGPVGAYFLHLKTYTQNGLGEEYESKWFPELQKMVGKEYLDPELSHRTHRPIPTCLRNHAMISEMNAGRGPIHMVTMKAVPGPAPGRGGLGELPRHDRRPGGFVGGDRRRPEEREPGADHIRTLCHGLPRDGLWWLGERSRRRVAAGIFLGLQPHDDGRGPVRGRRRRRRNASRLLVWVLHRGSSGCKSRLPIHR